VVWSPPPGALVHVPDGTAPAAVLARTTDLAVVAHPDDLELALPGVILACRADPERSFTGVICTDGAGSVRPEGMDPRDLVAVRAAEQRAAADMGAMGAVVLLGLASSTVGAPAGDPQRDAFVSTLLEVAEACEPTTVHTHNPADAHRTHVVVATATIDALRRLPVHQRPARVVGWEGWRDLDWLPADLRITDDLTGQEYEALDLARCHASQLAAKRYDLAAQGRRRANATFAEARRADEAGELAVAIDLSAVLDDDSEPAAVVLDAIDQFRRDVSEGLGRWW
jgi:LmbE family N-acetylglucosaminyl deacetylase